MWEPLELKLKHQHFVALAGDAAIGAGRTPRAALEAAYAALMDVYDPVMGHVQVDVTVHEATQEAFEAVSRCARAIAAGQLDFRCDMVAPGLDGVVDVLTVALPSGWVH